MTTIRALAWTIATISALVMAVFDALTLGMSIELMKPVLLAVLCAQFALFNLRD